MRLALRWKITLAIAVIMAVVLLGLDAYLQGAILRAGEERMAQSLLAGVRLAALALPSPPWQAGAELQGIAADLDQRSGARVTLIGGEGVVLADSREQPAAMVNHADRPERMQALGDGWGRSKRHSDTLQMDMLYVALALPDTGQPPVVLRLAEPMTAVHAASRSLREAVLTTLCLALALTWAAGYFLAGALTAPVMALVRVAQRVDRGDMGARAEGVRDPELGELAKVFNAALDRLAAMVGYSQRESRYYATILEQMSDAVVIVDQAGRVQFINPTFGRLFGVQETEAEGRSPEQITLNYDLGSLLLRAIEQKAVQHDEVRLVHPEGRILATVVTPLVGDDGAVIGAIGLLRDVTDLRRLDEVRREFVANASHELRTPAAGIRALAEALQVGAFRDPEKGPRFVEQIVEAADRLTSILDDMLTLTRVERGQELLSATWLPVVQALREATNQVLPAAQAKGVRVGTEAAEGARVYADPSGLQTILINLLDNAVKYTAEGGSVSVTGRGAPGGYELSVTDTGIGIPPEHQARVFERFYRVDKARDRATGGTGLGLSIVKHTAEAHGGRVSVRSIPGEGSTFTVLFPNPNEVA
jgi:two-component system phosphate regulon sensor histidine kinase PhoR